MFEEDVNLRLACKVEICMIAYFHRHVERFSTMMKRMMLLALPAFAALPTYAAETKAPAATPAAQTAPAAEAPKQEAKPADYTILEVDGEKISYSEVAAVWKELFPSGSTPEFSTFEEDIRQNVLRGIASEKLLHKQAVASGVDKSEDVQKRLETLKRQLLIQTFIEQKADSLVTEDALKKAYEEHKTSMKGKEELRARHILVDSEEKAKDIAAKLKKGEDFAKLAREQSLDKASGARGGDLDYFTPDKMVAPFSEAVVKLKKGEMSAPVKTDFGWHIIKLEDRRPLAVPSFEEMKEQLKADIRRKAVERYVVGLMEGANIKYFDESGKQLKFDVQPKEEASQQ